MLYCARTALLASLGVGTIFTTAPLLFAQATLRPIAQMLEPAPDPSGGTFYFANGIGTTANYVAGSPTDRAAFVSPITGPTGVNNDNNSTLYVGTHNAHTQLARTSNQVPDMPAGWTYSFLNEPRLYGNYVTFPVQMFQQSTQTTRPGYMGGTAADGVRLLWGQGSPAPTLSGVTLLNPQNPAMNSGGTVYFSSNLQGSGVTSDNNSATFTGTPGALSVYKRSGTQADALPAGVNYKFLGSPAVNESGAIAYNAIITGGGATSANDDVLYTGQPGSLALLARAGVTDVPGTPAGVKYNIITAPIINNAGKVAFRASITGPGVSFGNEAGIWAGTPGQLNLIMRDGSPAPGTTVNFNEPTEFYMADTGKLVFAAGIANNTGRGIWTGDESGLELLARVGDDAPDTAWNFTSLNNIAISRNGRIAFSGVLDAPGFQYGVWTTDENGDVHKLIQTGDTVNVEGVGPRTISSLLYGGQRTNDNFVIDDTGRVFLRAQFTNGLGGVFSVAIPEPGGLAAAGAALATLARRRRRPAPSPLGKVPA